MIQKFTDFQKIVEENKVEVINEALTRKDFDEVVAILVDYKTAMKIQDYKALCAQMAGFLAKHNSTFKRDLFLKSCNI